MLTKVLALEGAPHNIRVNAINPVLGDTPMLPGLLPEGVDIEKAKKALIDTIPLGRIVKPEDVAYAALYLASDESSMLTGSSIDVDGGRGI
jgi:3-oxoacyl-[acyl-carrier protein] reductase